MFSEVTGGVTSIRLANFYKVNQSRVNDNMVRIASGKKFQGPGIYGADYFHASSMKSDVRVLQQIDREITGASAMLDVAGKAGTSVFEDVSRMKVLLRQYYQSGTTDDEKTVLAIEFNAVKNRVTWTTGNTSYDSKKLIADTGATPLRQVVLDPRDVTKTFDISYGAGDVADVSLLTIGVTSLQTELDALETEFGKASSYLARTGVYSDSLKAFYNMNRKKEVTYMQNVEDTENIDGGKESMELTKRQLSQQMTVSMMAQANMFRSSVLSLLGIK